jgi:hypothetical protein
MFKILKKKFKLKHDIFIFSLIFFHHFDLLFYLLVLSFFISLIFNIIYLLVDAIAFVWLLLQILIGYDNHRHVDFSTQLIKL